MYLLCYPLRPTARIVFRLYGVRVRTCRDVLSTFDIRSTDFSTVRTESEFVRQMASPGLLYEQFQFVRTREGPNPASRDALSEKRSPHGRRWTERRPPDRMINLAALFVLSPTRPSSTSSRRLQARPEPFTSPCATRCPPPAFRHPAHASLCFASRFKGLQAGNLLRLSGAKLCRPALLGACWCTAACVPSRGAATAQCSACAAQAPKKKKKST